MNMKKLVLIGAVALVVLGCVIAAGCTSATTTQQTTDKDNAMSLPVGEWICTKYTTDDGKTVTAIQTIKADGTGYWMELDDNNPGFKLSRIFKSTFSKLDQNGAFEKASPTGRTHKMAYDAAKGTITQDGKIVYTRIDPIVGIWSGISSAERSYGEATSLIKPDGTGVVVVSYDDGTSKVTKQTWTKNTDGTYAMSFPDGTTRTYTIAPDGKTLKTNDGRTKTKQFLDDSFLVSVAGLWYNKDNGRCMVFNGDGTGVGQYKNEVIKFTWKPTDIGKFAVTYLEGTAKDGSSLKEKTYEWTYDRDNETFISSNGTKYIHPTESVEGKFTLV